MYFGSYKYPRELNWILGVFIFLLMMATSFLGYTLPWGQMSFWGATVITNLFSAIPIIGEGVVQWLWGGLEALAALLGCFGASFFHACIWSGLQSAFGGIWAGCWLDFKGFWKDFGKVLGGLGRDFRAFWAILVYYRLFSITGL